MKTNKKNRKCFELPAINGFTSAISVQFNPEHVTCSDSFHVLKSKSCKQ